MALSPSQRASIGSGVAGIGNYFFGDNPFDDYEKYSNQGENYIQQYQNQAAGYLDPYRQAGQQGLDAYRGMLSHYQDPTGYYNQIMGNWQATPTFQKRLSTGMDAIRNAMASRGLGGSGNELKGLTDYTQSAISQDMQQYLNNILGIGNTGLKGYGDLSHLGYLAGAQSGQYAMDAGQDLASMESAKAQAAAAQTNANNQNLWGGIGSLVSGFI